MESFKLKVEKRSKLYWGKFKYKCDIHIYGVWLCRFIDDTGNLSSWASISSKLQDQYSEVKQQIIPFNHWRLSYARTQPKSHSKISIYTNAVSVFSNDLDFLKDASQLGAKSEIVEVKLLDFDMEPGVLYFKRLPKFKHRIYLDFTRSKSSKDDEFFDYLDSLLKTYVGSGKMSFSPNIVKHLRNPENIYIWGKHNHINYDDPGFSTILRLTYPEYVYREYRLEKIPAQSTDEIQIENTE